MSDPHDGQHPKDRAIEDEDPMLLTAEPVDGDPELMFTSLVEEFARQGYDADHIMQLFESPFFQATWGLRQLYGEQGVRERIAKTIARCGVLRFKTEHSTTACNEPEIPDILNCAPPPGEASESSSDHTPEHPPVHPEGGHDAIRP